VAFAKCLLINTDSFHNFRLPPLQATRDGAFQDAVNLNSGQAVFFFSSSLHTCFKLMMVRPRTVTLLIDCRRRNAGLQDSNNMSAKITRLPIFTDAPSRRRHALKTKLKGVVDCKTEVTSSEV
jgi:hypothetical protein